MGDLIEMMWWDKYGVVVDVILAFMFCVGIYVWVRLTNTRK